MMACQDYNNVTQIPASCLELENSSMLNILAYLSPNCDRGAWTPRNNVWTAFFYIKLVAFSLLFVLLGVGCVVMVLKKHIAQRFKTKTFIAIDVSLSILGFSRFLFYLLDPYNISRYCDGKYCVVVSRVLFSLGFPSLTAAYTLVFLTLWYSAKMRLGRSCIQHWKIIIPLCFIHYVVAVVVEVIGAIGPYPLVFLLLACDAVFSLWGLFICATFLFAGCRLLQSIRRSDRQSSVVSIDRSSTKDEVRPNKDLKSRTYSVMRMKRQMKRHHKQAIRKITIITYITATLGGCYSILNLIQLVMVSFQLFGPCPEEGSSQYQTRSDVWLVMKYLSTITEFLLAVLLVYSINDITPFVKWATTNCFFSSLVDKERNQKDSVKKHFTYSYTESSESSKSHWKESNHHQADSSRECSPSAAAVGTLGGEKLQQTDMVCKGDIKMIPGDDDSSGNSVCKSDLLLRTHESVTNC